MVRKAGDRGYYVGKVTSPGLKEVGGTGEGSGVWAGVGAGAGADAGACSLIPQCRHSRPPGGAPYSGVHQACVSAVLGHSS